MCQDAAGYAKMQQDAVRCHMMVVDIARCSLIEQDVAGDAKMQQDAPRCSRML